MKLKVKLFKGKTNADGSHPIQLQFYLNGKEKRKTIYHCKPSDWDNKTCRVKTKSPNAAHINRIISTEYGKYEKELLKIVDGESTGEDFFGDNKQLTIDDVLQKELDRYRAENKAMTFARIGSYKKELVEHMRSKTTLIKNVDLHWFEKYGAFLTTNQIENGNVVRKANKGSTAQKKIKDIKRAIEKYLPTSFVDSVKKYRVPTKAPVKLKLTSEELSRIENLALVEGSLIAVCRDLFLLQVYLRGSRVGSLLKAYSFQFVDGRYSAQNSIGKNNVGSKLIPKAQIIVDKYIGKNERLFPLYKFVKDAKSSEFENRRREDKLKDSCIALVNKYLKQIAEKAEINKPLSTHIARHTFARMAIDKINNPMLTMELLGHKSLAVHQAYLNDIRKDDVLDAAADEIFG